MSEMFYKIWNAHLLQLGILETLYMTLISTAFSYLFGLPLGVILRITDKDGLCPKKNLNKILGFIVNFFRSIPFIVLMVAFLPVAKFIVGTSLGNKAVIVMLVIAASPYVARMVESSLRELDSGVIEAAKAMGSNTMQIITKVMIPESKPSLLNGAVISTITVLSYSAMAATIGGTGLGQIAIIYGHQRSNADITWICVILLVLITQAIQEIGLRIVRKNDKRIK